MLKRIIVPADYRHDPFLDSMEGVSVTNETHTIEAASPYTVKLDEVPYHETPSSLVVRLKATLNEALDASETGVDLASSAQAGWFSAGNVVTIDSEQMLVGSVSGVTLTVTRGYNSTTAATHTSGTAVYGPAMTEVAAAPSSGQFWPDYNTGADSDENWNTGTLKFNSADAGKTVAVTYQGTGCLMDHRFLTQTLVFTASGTVTIPDWIDYVILSGCGGGGGGGGIYNADSNYLGGHGGSGGCVIEYPVAVTPGETYAITVGAAGAGGGLKTDGTAGGNTTFGSLLTLGGGARGTAGSFVSNGADGADGSSPVAQTNMFGGDGADYGLSGSGWGGAGKGGKKGYTSSDGVVGGGGDGTAGFLIVKW